jgi:hypothetical protein
MPRVPRRRSPHNYHDNDSHDDPFQPSTIHNKSYHLRKRISSFGVLLGLCLSASLFGPYAVKDVVRITKIKEQNQPDQHASNVVKSLLLPQSSALLVRSQPLEAHQNNNRSIVFIHVGKTGGLTLKKAIGLGCKDVGSGPTKERVCTKQQHFSSDQKLVSQVDDMFHLYYHKPEAIQKATSYLITLRNPIEVRLWEICMFSVP